VLPPRTLLLFGLLAGVSMAQPEPPTSSPPDAVHSLAVEIASQKGLKTPLRVEWQNKSSLSDTQSRELQETFVTQLAAVRGLLGEGDAASTLRVNLHDTPSYNVVAAEVPTSSGMEIRLLRISRTSIVARASAIDLPYARKQLLWAQREPILDAVEWRAPENTGEALLLVLGVENIVAYREAQPAAEVASATLLGSLTMRDPQGRIELSNSAGNSFSVQVPGRSCVATVADKMTASCASNGRSSVKDDPQAAAADDSVAVALPCDGSRWTLASDAGDKSSPDHLLLSDANADRSTATSLFEFGGPVISLAAGNAGTAVLVTFNLSSGEYEVYRITLSCRE
jgi:hypothetical protein